MATVTKPASPVHHFARLWLQGLKWFYLLVVAGVVAILFGFNPSPSSIPILTEIQRYPLIGLAAVLLFILFTSLAVFLERHPDIFEGPRQVPSVLSVLTSVVLSSTGFVLFTALLVVVLARPSWCPTQICPAAPVVHQPGSAYDSNLEIYPIGVQSTTFAIPGYPPSYTAQTAPKSIGVERLDTTPEDVYKVAFSLHNLR